jgi:hypothetical protein
MAWARSTNRRIGIRSVIIRCEVGSIGGFRSAAVGRTSPRISRARWAHASSPRSAMSTWG